MKLFELDNALRDVAVYENEQDPIVVARQLIDNAPTGDDVVAELPDLIAQYAGHPLIDGIKEIMTNFTDASEITLLVDDLIAHYESTRDGIEEGEDGEEFEDPKSVAKRIDAMYKQNVNNVQQISHDSPEPYRAIMHTLLPNGVELDDNHNDYYWKIVDELEKMWAFDESIEEATTRRKMPNNVGEVRKRLRAAGFDVSYTDRTKLGYSMKIYGSRVLADRNETDTKEFKQALQRAQALAEKVESVVGNDGEVKLVKFYDMRGPGYQLNIRVIVEEEDAPYAHPETAMAVDEADYEGGIDFEPDAAFAGVKGVTTATGAGEKQAKDAGHKVQGEKVNAHWIKLLKAVKGMEADNPKRKELVQNLKQMAAVANKQGFELSPPAEKVFGLQSN